MPLRRRSTAFHPGNLCYPAQVRAGQGTWAYNNHYSYGPPPPPHSTPFYPPPPGPPIPPPAPSQNAVISPEDDAQRLFNVCKVGRGNAELLHEVLVYAKPQELKNDITKELLGRARASHELIGSQIAWATTQAEKSRYAAHSSTQTTQEQLLAALLGAHEQLTECLKMYDDLERIAIEQEAEERMKTERLIQALTAVAEYQPSSEEAPLIDWVFTIGDPEHTGKINPQTATRIFSASNLPPDALARTWEIASVDSKDGLLDRQGVGVALRLIGHAQKGVVVTEALVKRPGPLAELENISPIPSEPVPGPSTSIFSPSLPPLTTHDKTKFRKIFKASGAQNGILNGQQAKEVFMKSKLPWGALSEIWALADFRRRGHLDVADFTIAMYLIQALMTGKITSLPSSLPQHVYDEAAHHSPTPSISPHPPNLPPPPPMHPYRAGLSHSTSTLSPFSSPPPPVHPSRTSPQPQAVNWDISPATRVQATHVFSTLDPRNKGRAKGEAVRAYLHQSGMSSNATSRIWDLADVDRKGYLTRNEFVVAMHLIKIRKDGHHLPSHLPPGLLPPPISQNADDAYSGIAADSSPHLDPSAGSPQYPCHDSARHSTVSPESSGQRFRSTSHLPTASIAISSPPLAPVTPFPMSPLPGPTSYFQSQATGPTQWNISPEDRVRYDGYFDQLDTQRKGYLMSDTAVPFFARAKLPNEVMAIIWDLADSEHDGRLTRDDFAAAMHLIRQKLAGRDLPTSTTPLPSPSASSSRPTSAQPRRASISPQTAISSRRASAESRPQLQHQPQPEPEPQAQPPLDPTTVRLPDDLDGDLRSDTPPPPYELIAPSTP